MKLLYIASIDFFTKPNPSFHLMTSMLEDVMNAGINVEFIGCREEGLEQHVPEILQSRKEFSYKLIDIKKVPKNKFVNRYISGVNYAYQVGREASKVIDSCDVVFIQSSPTVVHTIRQIKKRVKNQKIIYNVQDMFPGSSIASGVMPNKIMQKFFYSLQKIAYKKSDYIVGISEDMKTKLIEQKVPEEKIRVIVNWFDDTSVREVPWSENRFVKKYNMSPEKFYVQYAGTMGYVFDYMMVIKVAELLKDYPDVVFQMIGEGSQKQSFIEKAKEMELANIQFLPLEQQEMVSDVYSACSVCLIPLKKGIIGNSVPSKAGLLMACKRPIITSVDEWSDYFKMISQNAGIAASNSSPKDVASAIIRMKNDKKFCEEAGIRGYEYGHISYSRTENMKKYISLFEECASQIN